MRPAQNALVILALFLVAGALFPWSPVNRLTCAGAAIVSAVVLLVVRLRAHAKPPSRRIDAVTRARIDRIRAEREARIGRRR